LAALRRKVSKRRTDRRDRCLPAVTSDPGRSSARTKQCGTFARRSVGVSRRHWGGAEARAPEARSCGAAALGALGKTSEVEPPCTARSKMVCTTPSRGTRSCRPGLPRRRPHQVLVLRVEILPWSIRTGRPTARDDARSLKRPNQRGAGCPTSSPPPFRLVLLFSGPRSVPSSSHY
jgi:hypothetical protein